MRRGVRLGIDVGAARIGVARSDIEGTLAVPVETIHLTKSSAAKAGKGVQHTTNPIEQIGRLIAEYEVLEVLVGNPLGLSGREGKAAELARDFAQKVAQANPDTPVILLDERLSTVQAQQNLHSAGISTRQGRSMIDQAAAVIILQTALDAERSTGAQLGTILGRP
ncbi:MAG: Holliday junction resolvase RuvX [Candidatus Nanopelagicales bacterium]